MNVFDIPYSGKVIPVPGIQEYRRTLLLRTLEFLTRCRWKLFHFKNPGNAQDVLFYILFWRVHFESFETLKDS